VALGGLEAENYHQYLAAKGRGRDEDFSSPPAQIPACAANAPGSSLFQSKVGKPPSEALPQCAVDVSDGSN
jgi:hypothetical protein